MTITINLTPELERQLLKTSAAQGIPAEQYVVGALSKLLGQEQPPNPAHLSPEESELLMAINAQVMSPPEWDRYHDLIARRQAETLTDQQRDELIATSDRLEAMNVVRVEKLIELAKLRGLTLDQVIDQLGMRRSIL